jgi:hypothetical protein
MKAQRYSLRLIVRGDSDKLVDTDTFAGVEKEVRHNVTACCELHARRSALERAWENGLLVSRFLSIKIRSL